MSHRGNGFGQMGLVASGMGLFALLVLGWLRLEMVRYLTLCSLLGMVLSLFGLFCKPRRVAVYGLVLGLAGTLYLPTMFLQLFTRR